MLRKVTSGLTRLLLATTLLGTMLGAAVAAPRRGSECPMSRMHGCCKKARQNRRAPGVGAARLCCVVNCPQPAPTGSAFTLQSSPGTASAPRPPAAQVSAHAQAFDDAPGYSPPFQPSHSPPAYIQHAAFLI
jgi:hypothetical protein